MAKVQYKTFSDNGTSWSDSVRITYDESYDGIPSAVIDPSSNIWVVFSSDRTGDHNI